MEMNEYQKLASRTANMDHERILRRLQGYPELLEMLNYALGAAGEAGEIVDEVKKVVYHGHDLDREKLIKEVGDKLWYGSQLARVLGYPLDDVAEKNIEKLRARYPEGFSEERSQNRME